MGERMGDAESGLAMPTGVRFPLAQAMQLHIAAGSVVRALAGVAAVVLPEAQRKDGVPARQ